MRCHNFGSPLSYPSLVYKPQIILIDEPKNLVNGEKMGNEILILGAGPAGMAAAFELHKAGKSFTVIEKNEAVGGLARTFQYVEFRTDVGPHRFFSQNKYLYDLIEDLLGEHWIKVDRLT